MEYTNTILEKMEKEKGLYNGKFSRWYYRKYMSDGGELKKIDLNGRMKLVPVGNAPETMFNRGERIANCCDLWLWDLYEKNKLLDLKKLNRCKNSRFCPNCKMLNVSKFIHEFRLVMPELNNYDLYLLTLTVPSCETDGVQLDDMLRKLSLAFQKLNRKYSSPLLTPTGKKSAQALQGRSFDLCGGVRVLEITHNDNAGFHPHYHCIVLVPKDSIEPELAEKKFSGKWSDKRQQCIMKSHIDIEIGKAWSFIWYGLDFRRWSAIDYDPAHTFLKYDGIDTEFKCLEVDFSPMDDDGLFEVFKYTFKSSEVSSFEVFDALVDALNYKRIRQGFGVLHNLKVDDDDDGETQPLELEFEEDPVEIMTKEFRELLTTFADYRKISRNNPAVDESDIVRIED